MTPPARQSAQELLALPAGCDLLSRWSGVSSAAALTLLQQTVLPLLHDHPRFALDVVEHVLEVRDEALDDTERSRLERLHAHCLKANGELSAAERSYRDSNVTFSKERDFAEVGRTAIGWADALALLGDFAEARRVLRAAERRLPRELGDLSARLLGVRAIVEYTAGRYDEAVNINRQALRRAQRRGNDIDVATCRYNLANIQLRRANTKASRRLFSQAKDCFEAGHLRVGVDQCRYGLAAVDLLEGKWQSGVAEMRDVRRGLEDRGDRRGSASVASDMARLFLAAGATRLAEEPARSALRIFSDLGLRPEQARACELHARVLAKLRRFYDARRRLDEAQRLYEQLGRRDRVWALRASRLESMAQPDLVLPKDFDAELRRILSHARRRSHAPLELRCELLRLHALLRRRQHSRAASLATKLHQRCKRAESTLHRPTLAIHAAEAFSALERGPEAKRWVRRALSDLARLEERFGDSATAGLTQLREDVASRATAIVLRHGGAAGPELALEILTTTRASGVVEDLMRGRLRDVDRSTREALARLRDELLDVESHDDDVRGRALRREVHRIEKRWRRTSTSSPRPKARILDRCRATRLRERLGDRALVLFDRGREGWQALVMEPGMPCRHVPLPDLATCLREHWTPTRMLFEAIARAPRKRRQQLLARSEGEARQALLALATSIWAPLELRSKEVVIVPHGALHALPLEAMRCELDAAKLGSVHRIPHPALLDSRKRTRPHHALLLQGTVPGAAREVSLVQSQLSEAGWTTEVGRDRSSLLGKESRLGLLHVAAHGAYHRSDWLANGLRLRDGWIGFEQLSTRRIRGALLFFDTCESGVPQEVPTTELDGWASAGFAAGADELVLTLWKVDDDSATAFARGFYRRFREGLTTPRAAHLTRLERRRYRPHPYHWGAHVVSSRRWGQ